MNPTEFAKSVGFTSADQVAHFEYQIPYVDYLSRSRDGQHEYLSLVHYEGQFVEAVYEIFLAPKQTRRPKGRDSKVKDSKYTRWQLDGFVSARATLLRDPEDIRAALT